MCEAIYGGELTVEISVQEGVADIGPTKGVLVAMTIYDFISYVFLCSVN
jgi:hypothetical protein